MICQNISVRGGVLHFAGQDTVALARQYGTPLYLMDEDYIRAQCRAYQRAFARHFGPGSRPLYASKACCFKRLYAIMAEEGMGIDVVSSGEMYTAVRAGYDLENAYFHGNSKTDADIAFGMAHGIGYFVADNREELDAIEAEAAKRGIRQRLLLRLTPGIDPHTYEAIATGKVDSKFGAAIETGQAEALAVYAMGLPHVALVGFHCHVGSQVFGEDVFERSARVMLAFMDKMARQHGCAATQLDLGGGYGVRYVDGDPEIDVEGRVAKVAAAVKECCRRLGMEMPQILMEPGRSIVAAAGMTLYTCGTVKRIPGYKNYVSVDGGMADNPRYALYRAPYTCYVANRMDEAPDFTASVVGRCCESGDILQENVALPSTVGRGDVIAVCTTGAYNYAMASHYNRLPKPPVVMLRGGKSYVAVQRESLEDLCRNDV